MKKNRILILALIVFLIISVVSIVVNFRNASEQNRFRRNMINHAYSALMDISRNLDGLLINIEEGTDYDTNRQSLIMLSNRFVKLDTILQWYSTIFPPKGISRNGYIGNIFGFDYIAYTLTSGTGTANGMPYSGITADGVISGNEVRYLTALRDDINLIIAAMVSTENPPNENQNLTSSQIDNILTIFFDKWSYHNEDSPYYLLCSEYKSSSDVIVESDLVGIWRADTGNATHFFSDGTGRTEGDDGIYEFTWEIISTADAFTRPRDYNVFQYTRNLSDSAADLGISWGVENIAVADPNDWDLLGYVLSLVFDGIDHKFDFAFTKDGQDILILNLGHLGQRLSPEQDVSSRLEWVTFTKEN